MTIAPTETEDGIETEICQNDNLHTRETRIAYATGTAGLEFTLQDGYYSVTGYIGVAEGIVIPAYYNRTPVASIGNNAFYLNKTLISVHIPSGVTSIEKSAFSNCLYLVEVTFAPGSQLLSIGELAFTDCQRLPSISIPEGVTSIGKSAFMRCGIVSITIPASVKNIDLLAFYNCFCLETITFSKGNQITSLGDNAFEACFILTTIVIEEGSGLISIGKEAFESCKKLSTIVIPVSVTSIGENAFIDCTVLTIYCEAPTQPLGWNVSWNPIPCPVYWASEWHIEDGQPAQHAGEWITVTSATCTETGLEKRICTVCGHEETQEIAALGHDWADEFTIDIPPACLEAGSKSIHCVRCSEKKDITVIPATGHDWGEWTETTAPTCMEDGEETRICKNDSAHTENRVIPATDHDWGEWTETTAPTCTVDGEETRICKNDSSHTENRVIPATGHDWGEWGNSTATETENGIEIRVCNHDETHTETRIAYATGTAGLEFTLLDDDTYSLSKGSEYAEEVFIPSYYNRLPVTRIEDEAFLNCTTIMTVTFGNDSKLVSIGNYSFASCVYLMSFELPDSVTSIGNYAFSGCDSLTSFTSGEDSNLISIDEGAFYLCAMMSYAIIPSGVTSMGGVAFGGSFFDLSIYCRASSQPAGWNENWCVNDEYTVYWANEWHMVDGVPTPL